ncbi:MAG: sulfatase-like hydrolase/transferase [Chthoniobacterales bacterium]
MTPLRTLSLAAGFALATGALDARGQPPPPPGQGLDKPNVVLIIIDELGYPFVGANGGLTAKGVPFSTPHIDRLAATGIRWTHAHARAMCGPTRQTLMTGKHGFRYGNPGPDETFLPELMQAAGYRTAISGKWMLGPFYNPTTRGFDEAAIYCGGYQFHDPQVMTFNSQGYLKELNQPPSVEKIKGGDMNCDTVDDVFAEGKATVLTGEFGPDVFNRFACDFIERSKDAPFFLYYATKLAHYQHPKIPGRDAAPSYAGSVTYVDELVGRIVASLEKAGVRDNTLILFIGDNGHANSPPDEPSFAKGHPDISGMKGGLWEGATRVPLIVNWPAGGARGEVRDELMGITDLLPTCVEVAQGTLPKNEVFDGYSLLPQIRGEEGKPREWVYIHNGSHPTVMKSELSGFYDGVPKAARRYAVGERYKLYWDGRFYEKDDEDRNSPGILLGEGSESAEAARAELQAVLNHYADEMGDHTDPTLVPKAEVAAWKP